MIAINSTKYNINYTIYITTIKLSDGTLQKFGCSSCANGSTEVTIIKDFFMGQSFN